MSIEGPEVQIDSVNPNYSKMFQILRERISFIIVRNWIEENLNFVVINEVILVTLVNRLWQKKNSNRRSDENEKVLKAPNTGLCAAFLTGSRLVIKLILVRPYDM